LIINKVDVELQELQLLGRSVNFRFLPIFFLPLEHPFTLNLEFRNLELGVEIGFRLNLDMYILRSC